MSAYKTMTLDGEQETIAFSSGTRMKLDWQTRAGQDRSSAALVLLDSPEAEALELPDALDCSQDPSSPSVTVIMGAGGLRAAIVGGRTAYIVSSLATVERCFDLYRKRETEEYWSIRVDEIERGILVVYETGIFLLSSELSLLWHRRKFLDDVVKKLESDSVHFVRDDQSEWRLLLTNGMVAD